MGLGRMSRGSVLVISLQNLTSVIGSNHSDFSRTLSIDTAYQFGIDRQSCQSIVGLAISSIYQLFRLTSNWRLFVERAVARSEMS